MPQSLGRLENLELLRPWATGGFKRFVRAGPWGEEVVPEKRVAGAQGMREFCGFSFKETAVFIPTEHQQEESRQSRA